MCLRDSSSLYVLYVEIHFFSCANLCRYKKLEDLLEKSFSLVKMPSLQPVVMCVMKHLPKVSTVEPALPDYGFSTGSCLALGKPWAPSLYHTLPLVEPSGNILIP